MTYTREWEDLTMKMGYWVDMENPYITYDNRYIESLWWLLKELFKKGLLYKGYSIQPYSPAAGTGLSTHELNQPGCYRDVKDTTCVAQFEVIRNAKSEFLFQECRYPGLFPGLDDHTLDPAFEYRPGGGSRHHLCEGTTFNPYTFEPVTVILAKERLHAYFPENNQEIAIEAFQPGDKRIPYKILDEYTGSALEGIPYHQLINWVNPGKGAFRVLTGDFVTTEDGTGIVHIAPTFGADDFRVAQKNDVPPLMVTDKNKQPGSAGGQKRPVLPAGGSG